MRAFRKRNAHGADWHVEVDYGDGWIPYSPPLHRRAADVFARDVRRCGLTARVAPATAVPDLEDAAADAAAAA